MSETMMTKHEIEIPDLPDGWGAVAYRNANTGEFVIGSGGVEQVRGSITKTITRYLIVEKIKPRRVVLEETEEANIPSGTTYEPQWFGSVCMVNQPKIWRIVEGE